MPAVTAVLQDEARASRIDVAKRNDDHGGHVHADLETLAVALYVKVDDELKARPELTPPRPAGGIPPRLSDAELVTMAVMQALLMFRSERRWVRYLRKHMLGLFSYQLKQAGYNKRLRAALPLLQHCIRMLAADTDFWFDNHWILDSTPVECGRSVPTVKRSQAAGWAGYGYCASHSRFFWGLRLYLICTRSVNADLQQRAQRAPPKPLGLPIHSRSGGVLPVLSGNRVDRGQPSGPLRHRRPTPHCPIPSPLAAPTLMRRAHSHPWSTRPPT